MERRGRHSVLCHLLAITDRQSLHMIDGTGLDCDGKRQHQPPAAQLLLLARSREKKFIRPRRAVGRTSCMEKSPFMAATLISYEYLQEKEKSVPIFSRLPFLESDEIGEANKHKKKDVVVEGPMPVKMPARLCGRRSPLPTSLGINPHPQEKTKKQKQKQHHVQPRLFSDMIGALMPCSRTLLPLLLPALVRLPLRAVSSAESRYDEKPLPPDMKKPPMPPLAGREASPMGGTELAR